MTTHLPMRSHEASTIIAMAGIIAGGLHNNFIGTEHLMLSLCQDHETARVLKGYLNLDTEEVQRLILERIEKPDTQRRDHSPMRLTPRSKKVLWFGQKITRDEFGLDHIQPRHVFLEILREGEGLAATVLKKCGMHYKSAILKFPMSQ